MNCLSFFTSIHAHTVTQTHACDVHMRTKQRENSYCQMVAPTLLNVTEALVVH